MTVMLSYSADALPKAKPFSAISKTRRNIQRLAVDKQTEIQSDRFFGCRKAVGYVGGVEGYLRFGELYSELLTDFGVELQQSYYVCLRFERAYPDKSLAVFFGSRRRFAHIRKIQRRHSRALGIHFAVEYIQADFRLHVVYVRLKRQLVVREHIQKVGYFGKYCRSVQFRKVGLGAGRNLYLGFADA